MPRPNQHAKTHISAIASATRFVIITAAGVLGIVAFSLSPVLTAYPIYAVRQQLNLLSPLWPEYTSNTYLYQKLEFDYVCGRSSASNAMITLRYMVETNGTSAELPSLNRVFNSASMAGFLQLEVRFSALPTTRAVHGAWGRAVGVHTKFFSVAPGSFSICQMRAFNELKVLF